MTTLLEIFNFKPEAKEKFEKWLFEHYKGKYLAFYQFEFSFQQGVVLEWLREQGIIVDVFPNINIFYHENNILQSNNEDHVRWRIYRTDRDYCPTQILLQAFAKALELINL